MQDTREEYLLNPFPFYKKMRAADPIHSIAEYGAWQVFRYDDVQRVLSDYAAFSSNFSQGQAQDPLSTSLISLDPPRHRQLRNIVTQAFTPRSVARLSDRITAIVTDLLDPIVSKGHMDTLTTCPIPCRSSSSPRCWAFHRRIARASSAGPTRSLVPAVQYRATRSAKWARTSLT